MVAAWLRGDSDHIYAKLHDILPHYDIDFTLSRLPDDLREHVIDWLSDNILELGEAVQKWMSQKIASTYYEAARRTNREDLHAVIAAKGPAILARDLPYIIQACRWRSYDRMRRQRKEIEIIPQIEFAQIDTAMESLGVDERLLALRQQLSRLANVDVTILWRSAEGCEDAAIAEMLQMTVEAVRQRRHRAIRRLRTSLENHNNIK